MEDFDLAKRCFDENLRLFASTETAPEKHNLYVGLTSLAEGLMHLEVQLAQLIQLLSRR